MSRKHMGWVLLFLVTWWLPVMVAALGISWGGMMQMPLPLAFMHKVATLFAYRQSHWLIHYAEVRYAGSDEWRAVPEDTLFGTTMFGRRSRMQRLLDQTHDRPEAGTRLREELARWIAERMRNASEGRPAEVRFVDAIYSPREHAEESSYAAPKIEAFRPERIVVVSVHPQESE